MLTANEAHNLKYDKLEFVNSMIIDNINRYRMEYQLNSHPCKVADCVYIPASFIEDSEFMRQMETLGYKVFPPDKRFSHPECARVVF